MRLTAATTLNELSSFAHHLTSIQLVVAHHVVAHHDRELGFVVGVRTQYTNERTVDSSANLEGQVLGSSRRHGQNGCNHLHAINLASLLDQLLGSALYGLCLEALNLLLDRVVLLDILLDDTLQVLGIVEECLHGAQHILGLIQQFLTLLTSLGLDTADAGSHTALRDNLEETDATSAAGVNTTTELNALAELYNADAVAVLLAKQGYGTQLAGFIYGDVTIFLERDILADAFVDDVLYLAQLFGRDLLEVREVETQSVGSYERAFLFYV